MEESKKEKQAIFLNRGLLQDSIPVMIKAFENKISMKLLTKEKLKEYFSDHSIYPVVKLDYLYVKLLDHLFDNFFKSIPEQHSLSFDSKDNIVSLNGLYLDIDNVMLIQGNDSALIKEGIKNSSLVIDIPPLPLEIGNMALINNADSNITVKDYSNIYLHFKRNRIFLNRNLSDSYYIFCTLYFYKEEVIKLGTVEVNK